MIGSITRGLGKLFGTKSDRDIKTVLPYVQKINDEYKKLHSISDDNLREKTTELKALINAHLKYIDDQIAEKKHKIEDNPSMDVAVKENIFEELDKLEEERNKELETVLLNVLPKAFAVVKETARRWKENGKLVVTATNLDHQFASNHDGIEIHGTTATWHNKWTAAGTEVQWEMLHYDVQLIGGIVLHQGKIAEMATGEGKTLVATLPAYLNALAGRGVHIVTVNSYLAQRDSEWMGQLFEFHGLTVDCIDKHQPNSPQRRKAYQCDITYGTNNEFGFDYLRDNMANDVESLVQRKHHYAMVDEVDSVLIDDARTPLIISGPVPKGDQHEFNQLKPRIQKLVDEQRKLVLDYLTQSKKDFTSGHEKEAGLPLFRAFRALPKHKPLIKFLSEPGVRQLLQKTENFYLQDNQKMMPEADAPLYFVIDEKQNQVDLTEKGIDLITGEGEDPNFFILPDLSIELDKIEKNTGISAEEKLTRKEKLLNEFSLKSERIHSVNQLLKAYTLFEKDIEYILVDGKVKIVDEQTGRVMEGRRYSDGLHQAIEAKENVKVEDASQTYATITLQNYFRMYHKLSGMTGTAETEAGEFWDIYELDVVVIPTNKPIVRDDREDLVYKTVREKFNAVADEIVKLTQAGRPVLVGTTSVEISELMSRMLTMRKIKHQVLNAKLHKKEADIVAEAGQSGTVTIATNMAGRGTDIKLSPESRAAGGLAIIGTERHESRRVDRQLRGRSGRQGDVGSSQFYVSLEDNLMRLFGSERIAKLMDRLGLDEGEVIQHSMISKSIERAQKKVEENNFGVRKRLLEYDDVMNSQREVIYKRRKNALYGERLEIDILNMFYDVCDDVVSGYHAIQNFEGFKVKVITSFGFETKINADNFRAQKDHEIVNSLYNEALNHYEGKIKRIVESTMPLIKDVHRNKGNSVENIVIPFADGKKRIGVVSNLEKTIKTEGAELKVSLEKSIALGIIDQTWTKHLRTMDDLKQSVQGAVYEQKDPLLIYKFEAYEMFKKMIADLNVETVNFLSHAEVPLENSSQVNEARQIQQRRTLNENKADVGSVLAGKSVAQNQDTREQVVKTPIRSEKTYNRNDKVSVQYADGSTKKDVKFKTVEEDVANGKCVVIED